MKTNTTKAGWMAMAAIVALTAQTGLAGGWGLEQLAGQVVGKAMSEASQEQSRRFERRYEDSSAPFVNATPNSSGEAAVIGVFQGLLGR